MFKYDKKVTENGNSARKNVTLMDFKERALSRSWKSEQVGFYENSQVFIFAYTYAFVGIFCNWIFFSKKS